MNESLPATPASILPAKVALPEVSTLSNCKFVPDLSKLIELVAWSIRKP